MRNILYRFHFCLILVVAGLFSILIYKDATGLRVLELQTYDWRVNDGRFAPIDSRLVFLGMDKANYRDDFFDIKNPSPEIEILKGDFPWSRSIWASTIRKLIGAGAALVILDINLPTPREGDEELKKAVDEFEDKVVLGFDIKQPDDPSMRFFILSYPSESILGSRTTPEGKARLSRLGYFNFWTDVDKIIRRSTYQASESTIGNGSPSDIHFSLSAQALKRLGLADKIPQQGSHLFRFAGPPRKPFDFFSIQTLFAPDLWEGNFKNGEYFKNKIVMIGPAGTWYHDVHPSPFSLFLGEHIPGPELHLNALNAALKNEFIKELPKSANYLILWGACLSVSILSFIIRKPIRRTILFFIIFALYGWISLVLYNHGYVIPVATPLIAFCLVAAISLTFETVLERLERARVRSVLERYVSKNIVREMLDARQEYLSSLVGKRKPVTILFSDIRNFTTITESADSEELVKQLNEYLKEMVECVFKYDGTLDKFIGDAVMAIWGNMRSKGVEADAIDAVRSALAMGEKLRALNLRWKSEGRMPLSIGIGINHGEVIVGNIGSPEKMDFTAIGDAVNLASRLEGLTKGYGLELIIGENVARLVSARFLLRTVDLVQVKGKTKPVEVFTVVGERSHGGADPGWLTDYNQAVSDFRARRFSQAVVALEKLRIQLQDDLLIQQYLENAREYASNPPDDSWTGVTVMTKK